MNNVRKLKFNFRDNSSSEAGPPGTCARECTLSAAAHLIRGETADEYRFSTIYSPLPRKDMIGYNYLAVKF